MFGLDWSYWWKELLVLLALGFANGVVGLDLVLRPDMFKI